MAVPANLVNKLHEVAAEMLMFHHSVSLEQLTTYDCISALGRHRPLSCPQDNCIAIPCKVAFVLKVPGVIRGICERPIHHPLQRHSFLSGRMARKNRLPPIAPYRCHNLAKIPKGGSGSLTSNTFLFVFMAAD
jgi:hypothetical protein